MIKIKCNESFIDVTKNRTVGLVSMSLQTLDVYDLCFWLDLSRRKLHECVVNNEIEYFKQ